MKYQYRQCFVDYSNFIPRGLKYGAIVLTIYNIILYGWLTRRAKRKITKTRVLIGSNKI